ncbi:MAG TPA: hypothetical protein VD767_04245 [Thermomicrobiales bacterium]|nr:hypothetical protein [Thermomicrobiales bacterium]
MFPISTTMGPGILARQTDFGDREGPIPNRLDYQRRLLEYKKMQSIDPTLLYPSDSTLNTRLERQRQIIEAFEVQPSLLARIRTSFGRTLIAAGERIRPDDVVTERTANA